MAVANVPNDAAYLGRVVTEDLAMEQTINPDLIQKLAERRGIRSAKQLAQRLCVSERTAYRIWAGDIAPRSRAVTLEKLAEQLGVDVAVLTGEAQMPAGQSDDKPEDDLALRLTTLKRVVGTEAANALALNAIRYRVSITMQAELAALLFHVIAQRSLKHRRETLEALKKECERLDDEIGRVFALERANAPHLPGPGNASFSLEQGLLAEESSINAEDIFAQATEFADLDATGEAPVRQNPFAEEIRRLAAGLPDIDAEQIDVTADGVSYVINRPQAMTLADGDEELAECILDGRIKLKGLGKLIGDDRTQERVAELRRRLDDYWAEIERRFGKIEAGDADPVL